MKPGPIYKANHEAVREGSVSLGNTAQAGEHAAASRQGLDATEQVLGRLQAIMDKLYAGLQKMCQYHNYINTDTIVCYELGEFGMLDCLRQGEYRVSVDDLKHIREVVLSFDCLGVGEQDVSIKLDNAQARQRLEQYLQAHGLRFALRPDSDSEDETSGGEFVIQKYVPVSITFGMNVENNAIDLAVCNLERLGSSQAQIVPEAIAGGFLDDLAKCVVGEKDCECLFKNDISIGQQAVRSKSL